MKTPPRSAATTASLLAGLDDCWKRIGIQGDQSCPRLTEHIHCRNCPVHAQAASLLLDRPAPLAVLQEMVQTDAATRASEPILVFRIGDEWLGLPAVKIAEIIEPRPIHVLPHRRGRMVQGMVNVRGVLTVCVSLAEMLGLGAATRTYPGAIARLLVTGNAGRNNAIPVDAVYGIARFAPAELGAVPGTVARAAATYTRKLARWQEHSVGLLDSDLLFYSIDRGLA